MVGADAAAVVTERPQRKETSRTRVATAMRQPVLFDGRNLLDPVRMRELGFTYMSAGRPQAARACCLDPQDTR
ncbi:hypothetical protein ACFRJ7_14440 [Streptomyces sp. NPDC056747]|uniref:hypothetical protein n=1 Tax=Streptomyces sp. NPDC056747 TaxID=3345935 RepID=UPI00369473E2